LDELEKIVEKSLSITGLHIFSWDANQGLPENESAMLLLNQLV